MAMLLLGCSVWSDHPVRRCQSLARPLRTHDLGWGAHLRRAFLLARSSRFQDIALQTFARVPEKGVDGRSCHRARHAEPEARLDRDAVGEPRAARRHLFEEVVLRQRVDEREGMRREIEREAAILLPAEEVLVNTEQRKPDCPGGSHAVRLAAGPDHLAYAAKPSGPGF